MSLKSSQESETDRILPAIPFKRCPIRTSLGALGRKWTLLILRDIAFLRLNRFNQILDSVAGLTPRVLTMRLRQLEREDIIERISRPGYPKHVEWQLTHKGRDIVPILMAFIGFGAKWYSEVVFEDGKPRSLQDLFPSRAAPLTQTQVA